MICPHPLISKALPLYLPLLLLLCTNWPWSPSFLPSRVSTLLIHGLSSCSLQSEHSSARYLHSYLNPSRFWSNVVFHLGLSLIIPCNRASPIPPPASTVILIILPHLIFPDITFHFELIIQFTYFLFVISLPPALTCQLHDNSDFISSGPFCRTQHLHVSELCINNFSNLFHDLYTHFFHRHFFFFFFTVSFKFSA